MVGFFFFSPKPLFARAALPPVEAVTERSVPPPPPTDLTWAFRDRDTAFRLLYTLRALRFSICGFWQNCLETYLTLRFVTFCFLFRCPGARGREPKSGSFSHWHPTSPNSHYTHSIFMAEDLRVTGVWLGVLPGATTPGRSGVNFSRGRPTRSSRLFLCLFFFWFSLKTFKPPHRIRFTSSTDYMFGQVISLLRCAPVAASSQRFNGLFWFWALSEKCLMRVPITICSTPPFCPTPGGTPLCICVYGCHQFG